jgi:hypothetical protein
MLASRRVVAVVGGRGVSVRTLATTQTSPEVLYVIDYVVLALRMARHSPVRRHLWTLGVVRPAFLSGHGFCWGVCMCGSHSARWLTSLFLQRPRF